MADFAGAAARWLAAQPEPNVRIAREIVNRRAAFADLPYEPPSTRAHESGVIWGMRLALSYLGDRPGDISETGAEGFIGNVEHADRIAQEGRG